MAKRKNYLIFIKKEGHNTVRLIGTFGQEDKAYAVGRQWSKWGYLWSIVILEQNVELEVGADVNNLKWY